jgi:hypothetical protein
MSWSFNAIGKPAAVATKARTDLERITCQEPEQSLKAMVISAIETACSAMPTDQAVRIEAYGSQSYSHGAPDKFSNNMSLKIEPIYGFVE